MVEESKFTNEEIVEVMWKMYGIKAQKIEIEERGSANIFYIYDEHQNKCVLKEFESARNDQDILKEIRICNHLKNDGIPVATYIPTNDGEYYFMHKGRVVILMEYIDGYVKESNTGNYEQVMESAEILGKVVKSLETFDGLEEESIEQYCNGEKLKLSKIKYEKLLKQIENSENIDDTQIRKDIEDKLKIINELENLDFSEMRKLSMKNCSGDFSIMQFIYQNEKVIAVLDFAKSKKMPFVWEIIRSYSYIDENCKNGRINEEVFKQYIQKVREYVEVTEIDLKWMKMFYLVQLVCSSYGYGEFLADRNRRNLLEFARWRTEMCRGLSLNCKICYKF